MDPSAFELNLSLPADPRFADAMRDLAAHAAHYAGSRGAEAKAFATAVETAARGCLAQAASEAAVPVVVRRGGGPVEILMRCDRRFDIGNVASSAVTIEWPRGDRGMMCRVALDL
jgi:predicted NUDIX family NTP pyrophosphohydrolase